MENLTDERYGEFPTLEEIVRDFSELYQIINNISRIEQLEKLINDFTIEINGMDIDDYLLYGNNEGIEWIRYENYGCLDYIYVRYHEDGSKTISFDVWSNLLDDDFITNSSIDNVYSNYDRYVDIARETLKKMAR